MKRVCFGLLLFFCAVCAYAQESEDIDSLFESAEDITADGESAGSEDMADDLDSLFNEDTDIEVPADANALPISNLYQDVDKFKLMTWGGYLDASVGLGYYWQPGRQREHDVKAGIEFKNDLYFSARPSDYLAIKGTFLTEFNEDNHDRFVLELSELYFDYSALNYVFFKGGKLETKWSNVVLFDDGYTAGINFSGDTQLDSESNILADSKNGLSLLAIIPIPVLSMNLQLLAMYNFSSISQTVEPSLRDLDFAALFEFVVWKTSIQFFARMKGDLSKPSQAGLQLKRTLWGFDVYTQLLTSINDKISEGKTTKFEDVQFICGTYRLWDSPKIGFNVEYLYKDDFKNKPVHRVALRLGWANLAHNKIALALEWEHNFTTIKGEVTPGVIIQNVFPHANLEMGSEIEYGSTLNELSLGLGVKLHLNITY